VIEYYTLIYSAGMRFIAVKNFFPRCITLLINKFLSRNNFLSTVKYVFYKGMHVEIVVSPTVVELLLSPTDTLYRTTGRPREPGTTAQQHNTTVVSPMVVELILSLR
jgi:hypothetical protein